MTGGTGLRRFVPGPPATSPAPDGQAAAPEGQAGPAIEVSDAGPLAPAGRAAAAAGHEQPAAAAGGEEACEMCATEIPADHGHVADLEQSTLMCACRACYLLFTHSQAGRGRYRSIPDRYLSDPDRPLSVAEWDALEVPVGLAFFLRTEGGSTEEGSTEEGSTEEGSTEEGSSGGVEVTGFYPSPAGATECRLDLQAWQRIAESHPMLSAAAPDVEAILISRGDAGVDCFLVPIDACYELAGRMRLHWRGFDGGSEAKESIAEFLDGVRSRARAFRQEP